MSRKLAVIKIFIHGLHELHKEEKEKKKRKKNTKVKKRSFVIIKIVLPIEINE